MQMCVLILTIMISIILRAAPVDDQNDMSNELNYWAKPFKKVKLWDFNKLKLEIHKIRFHGQIRS
jgi:hypothetical protein